MTPSISAPLGSRTIPLTARSVNGFLGSSIDVFGWRFRKAFEPTFPEPSGAGQSAVSVTTKTAVGECALQAHVAPNVTLIRVIAKMRC